MEGLEAAGSVDSDAEVTGERWTKCRWPSFWVDLEVVNVGYCEGNEHLQTRVAIPGS